MMFAAAAVVRDDQGRTFYEHPDAFTTTQLVFFPRLTDSELALYQADAIYEDEILLTRPKSEFKKLKTYRESYGCCYL